MSSELSKNEGNVPVNDLIDAVLKEMKEKGPTAPEYQGLLMKLTQLTELRDANKPKPFSRDTILMVAANLFGILIIVMSERKHVLSQKGFTQLPRLFK